MFLSLNVLVHPPDHEKEAGGESLRDLFLERVY